MGCRWRIYSARRISTAAGLRAWRSGRRPSKKSTGRRAVKTQDPHHHDYTEPPSELELRVKSLESLLVEKGLVDPAAVNALIDTYENRVGPRNGARVIARAWSDPAFKEW